MRATPALRSAFLLTMLAACASGAKAERPESTQDRAWAEALVYTAASDRTDHDRAEDAHRKPVDTLLFFGVKPGMRVADLGAGGGYSTELFARAVGPQGKVYAQDTPNWGVDWLKKAWDARLARPSMQNTQHFIRQWDDPLPPEASGLDAVYTVAAYHDVISEKSSTAKLNAAVFAALKPGGIYAIIDNRARDGSGAADAATLHRIDKAFLRAEVERAGFKFVAEESFLANPQDARDWNADPTNGGVAGKVHTQDRFALRFVKP